MTCAKDRGSTTLSVIIDRIEGDQTRYAIIELPDLSHIDLPLVFLPDGVREGDSLSIIIRHDVDSTIRRREQARRLQEDLISENR